MLNCDPLEQFATGERLVVRKRRGENYATGFTAVVVIVQGAGWCSGAIDPAVYWCDCSPYALPGKRGEWFKTANYKPYGETGMLWLQPFRACELKRASKEPAK